MKLKTAIAFDDNDLWCELYKRIFDKNQISIKTYSSPKHYFCQKEDFDLCPVDSPCTDFLITDHNMPEMTGLEFMRKAKKMRCKIPDNCKAIISGTWTEEEFEEAKKLCCNVLDKSDGKNQISLWLLGYDRSVEKKGSIQLKK